MASVNNTANSNNVYFSIESGRDHSTALHMHKYFEIILVTSGSMYVTADSAEYTLRRGEAVLIFPNQVHSMKTPEYSRYVSCVFSPELISEYSKNVDNKTPSYAKVSLSGTEYELLADLSESDDSYKIKGTLYLLCSTFSKEIEFKKSSAKGDNASLLHKIFDFIQANYSGACSLSSLADHLQYDYSYLSKFFSTNVGMTFNEYVRKIRIDEACFMLRDTRLTVAEISRKCGFTSVRSFNRNFVDSIGTPPLAYRASAQGN